MRAIVRRLWPWMHACAALSLFGSATGFGTSAFAQAPPDPNLWTRPTLTGDWGGVRYYLDRNGVTFTFNYTNGFLANVRGGVQRGAVGLGVFQPQMDVDLQKLLGWDGGRIHTHGLPFQSGLPRQHPRRLQSRSRAGRAALLALVRAECLQRPALRSRGSHVGGQPVSPEQDGCELHQQRHQLADVSCRQS